VSKARSSNYFCCKNSLPNIYLVMKQDCDSNLNYYSGCGLVELSYVMAGRVDSARRLFDGTAEKDVVAWNGTAWYPGTAVRGASSRPRVVRRDAGPGRGIVDSDGAWVRAHE
jgi:hypothetical protein